MWSETDEGGGAAGSIKNWQSTAPTASITVSNNYSVLDDQKNVQQRNGSHMAARTTPSARPLQAVYVSVSQKFTVPSVAGTIPLSVSSPEPEPAPSAEC